MKKPALLSGLLWLIFAFSHLAQAEMRSYLGVEFEPFSKSLGEVFSYPADPTGQSKTRIYYPNVCVPKSFFTSLFLSPMLQPYIQSLHGQSMVEKSVTFLSLCETECPTPGACAGFYPEKVLDYIRKQNPTVFNAYNIQMVTLERKNNEENYLARIHSLLAQSLKNGFIPVANLVSQFPVANPPESGKPRMEWVASKTGHQIAILKVQATMLPKRNYFEFEYYDPDLNRTDWATAIDSFPSRGFAAKRIPRDGTQDPAVYGSADKSGLLEITAPALNLRKTDTPDWARHIIYMNDATVSLKP